MGFIISDCELIFSRALPVGIFCAWTEAVSLLRGFVLGFVLIRLPGVLPASGHFYASFRALWSQTMNIVYI